MCIVTAAGFCVSFVSVDAGAEYKKTFTVNSAKNLALANSRAYKKLKIKTNSKLANYDSSVKALRMQEQRLKTFSWNPLLSFKLPSKPSLTQQFEFNVKPLQLTSEISSLRHQLSDKTFEIYEEAVNLYVRLYTLQQSIDFNEKRLEEMKGTLERNKIRLLTGEAVQSDIDSMTKAVDSLTKKIANDKKSFETGKKDMTKLTGQDVTTQYRFSNPYSDWNIDRSKLSWLKDYTLTKSQAYYDARLAESLALTSMDTYYNLMYNNYGSKMNTIRNYYQLARTGKDIDIEAFKRDFDKMLENVNSPWTGSFKVFFVKLKKSWFQGATDGKNYVEDEPYALYNSILDYQDAINETESTKNEIIKEVESGLETLLTLKTAYNNLNSQLKEDGEDLQKALLLNSLGELSYDEYSTKQSEYEELELEVAAALDEYTQSLSSYDRLTCGAITALMSGADTELGISVGGDSFLVEENVEGISYYINQYVEDNVFELGIYVPEGFELDITDFELWVDNMQIGERTPVSKVIRHLTLTVEKTERVWLRFYDADEFVDDVDIDPDVYYDVLKITKGYHLVESEGEEEKLLGTYSIKNGTFGDMQEFTFKADASHPEIAYYRLMDSAGTYLCSDDYVPCDTSMTYLGVLKNSISELNIALFDSGYNLIFTGQFDQDLLQVFEK